MTKSQYYSSAYYDMQYIRPMCSCFNGQIKLGYNQMGLHGQN
jgi:hypothetical protein